MGTQEACTGILTFGCNSSLPIISSSSGWSPLPQCHSRADSPAFTQSLCSAPTRENLGALELLTLQTPSEKRCLTLQTQKHSTKTFSWLSSPASSTSDPHGNLTIEQLLRGAREMLALPSLGAEHCPRSHTQFGNLGLGQVLCIRMAESSEIVS